MCCVCICKGERLAQTVPAPKGHGFGTFGGVFTPSVLTILGVIMFMRANFVVGEAGILGAVVVLLVAQSITIFSAMSVCAISTNMQVRGGGAYFMISRVLGPEFGGAIGIALFFAQALSVPFYILGFAEALTLTVPSLQPYFLWITLVTAVLLAVIAIVGASIAVKAQYVIMGVLVLSITAFLGGAIQNFETERFHRNLMPPKVHTVIDQKRLPNEDQIDLEEVSEVDAEDLIQNLRESDSNRYNFWILFAIYFPAVTGILTGVNMSGDLKNPTRSIPLGTLWAVAVGFVVYLIQMMLCGGAYERIALVNSPYDVLKDNALLGAGFLVALGVSAATLSSALGSFLAAPRILQAVARDGILDCIRPFAKGMAPNDEPRRGLYLSAVMTVGVLVFCGGSGGAALNMVAGVITMFFLYTYGMINVAAFIEHFGRNPSFRPRFRYFHWFTALLGTAGCLLAALLINAGAALAAMVLILILLWRLKEKQLESTFGDARRGFYFETVRKNLLRLAATREDSRNWRPTILAFSGNPASRELLISYATWLESGRGIVYLANIVVGEFSERHPRSRAAIRQLDEFCRSNSLQAFPLSVVTPTVEEGVRALIQTAAIGPLPASIALFGWCGSADGAEKLLGNLRTARAMGMSQVVVKCGEFPMPETRKRIDIWWRGRRNGHLMAMLAHLMTGNWEWRKTTIRVLRLIENEAGREPALQALRPMIEGARFNAETQVVVSQEPFKQVLRNYSKDADCIFLGFELPEPDQTAPWHERFDDLLEDMPTTLLISAAQTPAGEEDLLA